MNIEHNCACQTCTSKNMLASLQKVICFAETGFVETRNYAHVAETIPYFGKMAILLKVIISKNGYIHVPL
jgi:hypothetical protein